MPEYLVRMRNSAGAPFTVHVKAESEQEAKRIALEHARKSGFTRHAIVSNKVEKQT